MLVGNSRIACVSKMALLSLTEIRHIFWAFFSSEESFLLRVGKKSPWNRVLNST